MNRRERRKQQLSRQRDAAAANHPAATQDPTAESPSAGATGPTTEYGKSVSSRNAVKHNLCAAKLTGPDLDELNAIRAALDNEWQPQTETERLLLAQMALSQWRMDRAFAVELSAFHDGQVEPKLLELALRYRTAAERAFFKALAEIQRLRKSMRDDARREEKEQQQAIEREIERYIMGPIGTASQFVSQSIPAPLRSAVSASSLGLAEPRVCSVNPANGHLRT